MSQASETDLNPTAGTAAVHPSEMNLVWIDMEMTGLDPDINKIFEIAANLTDWACAYLLGLCKDLEARHA